MTRQLVLIVTVTTGRAFLTDGHSEHASWLRDQYRHFPDEFVLCSSGHQARDLASPGLRAEVAAMRAQVAGLEEVVRSLATLTQAMVARGQAEVADWAAVARDLGTVTNQPLMLRSDKDKDLYYAVAKEVAETSRHHDIYPSVSVCAGGRAERRRG